MDSWEFAIASPSGLNISGIVLRVFGPDWDAILGRLRRQAGDGRYRVFYR